MRESSWAQIGTDVRGSKNLDDVLKRSNLDFEVVKRPIFTTARLDGKTKNIQIPGYSGTINKNTGESLGIVSNRYEIIQNREAFDFVDSMGDNITFEKAGITGDGMVYILARLADRDILGDKYQPFVVLENSFNGGYSLKACIAPLRIVCQNQVKIALRNASNTVTIRHSGDVSNKIENAREILMASDEYLDAMTKVAEKMAAKKISTSVETEIIEQLYPILPDANQRSITRIMDKRAEFINAYNAEDNQNFRGTLWGLVNAGSDLDTHYEPVRKTDNWLDNRFINTVNYNEGLVPKIIDIAGSLVA